jgi:4a-hydroxytetrahydrobiopterin dehydratase
MSLSQQVCTACSGDSEKLKATEALERMEEISDDWELEENHHIERKFEFEDFREALDFVNKVGEIAEDQGHHPVINDFTWGRATIKLYTHKIDGLHDNDFIMAAKIDEAFEEFES